LSKGAGPIRRTYGPELVSTDRPWLESVFAYLPGGPVYLNSYRREIVDAGFRLRPRGAFYQVLEPDSPENYTVPAGTDVPVERPPAKWKSADTCCPRQATAGEFVPLTLAMMAPVTPTHYYVPAISVGPVVYTHTTDSHLLTTWWQPDEVWWSALILLCRTTWLKVSYPVTLHMVDLTAGERTELALFVGGAAVSEEQSTPNWATCWPISGSAWAWQAPGPSRAASFAAAPWQEPIVAQRGKTLNLCSSGKAWRWPRRATRSSYISSTPKTGRTLRSTTPHSAALPPRTCGYQSGCRASACSIPTACRLMKRLAPGLYLRRGRAVRDDGQRRLHIAGPDGSLQGDRYILGPVLVE
jgi:hypothetical protein